jgi:Restriction endonuclease
MAVTKTLGPLHFEDLEPHRFEDLVRELVYDFKDWQSIEATGRGGADDGFDIRAYERTSTPERETEDGEPGEDEEPPHPMEGNLWMFQCKRESEIGPTKVGQIIDEGVKSEDPYGYVLVAPANFSKKSFDVFREELRSRGVMEFYLWERAALEDMLHLPKNDRVLFAFFGISLASRRRSRATDIRAIVARKNKLIRIFGEQPHHQPILARDLKDTHYPNSAHYQDFDTKPRWRAYSVIGLDPRGLILNVNEYFAYRDRARGEWDMTEALNLAHRHEEDDHERRRSEADLREKIEGFWHFIPHANRAMLVRNGLVKFEDIAVIDDKGDSEFHFPHIFVDFYDTRGPFFGFAEYLKIHEHRREPHDDLKRVERFPETFEAPKIGTVHDTKLQLASRVSRLLSAGNASLNTLYDVEGRLDFLAVTDVIGVEGTAGKVGGAGEPILIQITHKRTMTGKEFLESLVDNPTLKHQVEEQVRQAVTEADQLRILEFKRICDWAIERSRGGDSMTV